MRAHARIEVASFCRACGELIDARRSTRRFCSSACRKAVHRAGRRPLLVPIAHQRRIRDIEASRDPRPAMATLEGATVVEIPFAEAKALVIRYEHLGSMPSAPTACYGLRTPEGELAGVVCFHRGPAPESNDLCGREHRDDAICLARGACVHWAHPHAASFLISRACKLASAEFGWKVFYAYADPRSWQAYAHAAGEPGGSQKSFSAALAKQGFAKHRAGGVRYFRGIRLHQDGAACAG